VGGGGVAAQSAIEQKKTFSRDKIHHTLQENRRRESTLVTTGKDNRAQPKQITVGLRRKKRKKKTRAPKKTFSEKHDDRKNWQT